MARYRPRPGVKYRHYGTGEEHTVSHRMLAAQIRSIRNVSKWAKAQAIVLRQELQAAPFEALVRDTYNGTHPKRKKRADDAKRKLKTIARTGGQWNSKRKLPRGRSAPGELETL